MKKADLDDGYFKLANALGAAILACPMTPLEAKIFWFILLETYGRRVLVDKNKLRAIKSFETNAYQAAGRIGSNKSAAGRALKRLINRHIIIAFQGGYLGINTSIENWAGIDPQIFEETLPRMGFVRSPETMIQADHSMGARRIIVGAGQHPSIGAGQHPTMIQADTNYVLAGIGPIIVRGQDMGDMKDMRERGSPAQPAPLPPPAFGIQGETETARNDKENDQQNTPPESMEFLSPAWAAAQDQIKPRENRDPAHRLARAYQRGLIGFPIEPNRQAAWDKAQYPKAHKAMQEILDTTNMTPEDGIEYVLESTQEKKDKPGFNLRWLIEDATHWAATRRTE